MQLASDEDWEQVTATVVESTYHYARLWNLSGDDEMDNSFYQITFYYDVHGERFYDHFEQFEPLDPQHTTKILYNPARPGQNSLTPKKPGFLRRMFVRTVGALLTGFLTWLWHHLGLQTTPTCLDLPLTSLPTCRSYRTTRILPVYYPGSA